MTAICNQKEEAIDAIEKNYIAAWNRKGINNKRSMTSLLVRYYARTMTLKQLMNWLDIFKGDK